MERRLQGWIWERALVRGSPLKSVSKDLEARSWFRRRNWCGVLGAELLGTGGGAAAARGPGVSCPQTPAPAPRPGCLSTKPQLASGCASERFVWKKQEVINLRYLELMRQKYRSDLDIMLMMSDMETSNTLTNFKEEQIGNNDLWRKMKCSRFM